MKPEKESKLVGMVLFSCEKYKPKRCKGNQPCQILVPAGNRDITGCPIEGRSGKWVHVPTTRLTV